MHISIYRKKAAQPKLLPTRWVIVNIISGEEAGIKSCCIKLVFADGVLFGMSMSLAPSYTRLFFFLVQF